MVVVAIIALLMSILLPSLANSRKTSRMVVCQSNLRQFAVANEMYADQNNNGYVPIKSRHGTRGSGYYAWFDHDLFMKDMLGMDRGGRLYLKLLCPDLPYPERDNPSPWQANGIRPGGTDNNYGWNRTGVSLPDGWNSHIEVNRLRIVRPSEKIHNLDGTDWHTYKSFADPTARWDIYGEGRLWSVAYRHLRETACIVYADGHTGYMDKYQLWPVNPIERDRMWELYK